MNSSQPTYVVGLMGGLGNNLHQIALGKYLEEKGFRVKFDITLISPNATVFEIPSLRDFVLDRKKLLWNFLPSPLGRFRFIAIQIRRLIGPMRVVTSLKANDSIDIKDSKGSWLYGYWQRLDYSESIMEELKDFFLPSYQIGDSIRIHVRHGDFVGTPSLLDDSYYECALDELINDKNLHNPVVQIISDSQSLDVKSMNLAINAEQVSSATILADFQALINSKYLIISRSTFSWWAARISNADVICPSPWNSLNPEDDSEIPSAWKKILVN